MVKKDPTDTIRITSASQCMQEFDILKATLLVEESEDTWQKIDASLKRFTAVIRGGACDYPDEFVRRWRETEIVRGLVNAMSTERTRLSGTALDLVGSTARLGHHWELAVPFYVPSIIKLLGRASKIYVTRATIALTALIKGTKSVAFIPYLIDGISEKSLTMRIGCAEALLCCLVSNIEHDGDKPDQTKTRNAIRDGLIKRLNDVENAIKIGGRDRDPKVRAVFKRIWELYEEHWPSRAVNLSQPFTPTIRRYLGIAHGTSSAPTTHAPSSSSGKLHASQSSNKSHGNNVANSRDKPPLSGHQRTGSRNLVEAHPPSVKSVDPTVLAKKFQPPQSATAHSGDLATLRKAMAVPLPPDEPHPCYEHKVNRPPGRALAPPPRPGAIPEASLHKPHSSGSMMKRSNSTMRAQRVPLAPQADLPGPGAAGFTRTATRAPLQVLQSVSHQPGTDALNKPTNATHPLPATHIHPHMPPSSSDTMAVTSKTGFKPSRTPSGSVQVESNKPSAQLQTRPLPRRAAPAPAAAAAPPPFEPHREPSVGNALNISVRSNSRTRKAQAEEAAPVIKQTRKAFKPTKSALKSASETPSAAPPKSVTSSLTASLDSTLKEVSVSNPAPAASKMAMNLDELPESLRIPALTPLPSSPAPPSRSSPPLLAQPPSLAISEIKADVPSIIAQPGLEQVAAPTCVPAFENAVEQMPNPPAADGTSQPSAKPAPPPSHAFARAPSSFYVAQTPGPKICTRLPDDLIVPMSVPLPPSPNSPFIHLGGQLNKTKSAPRSNRKKPVTKPVGTPRTPRVRTKSGDAQPCVVPKGGASSRPKQTEEPGGSNMNKTARRAAGAAGTQQSDEDEDGDATQRVGAHEGLLVDFDHEDTIWIPRTPASHRDLMQLTSAFKVETTIEEADEGEDGPDEKRPRLDIDERHRSAEPQEPIAQDDHPQTICADPETPRPIEKPRRRDRSIFHWDQRDLTNIVENSEDRTISCLKEQPDFLAGDVTVNDGRSFLTNFLSGITPQNQSTPASSVNEDVFRRYQTTVPSP